MNNGVINRLNVRGNNQTVLRKSLLSLIEVTKLEDHILIFLQVY